MTAQIDRIWNNLTRSLSLHLTQLMKTSRVFSRLQASRSNKLPIVHTLTDVTMQRICALLVTGSSAEIKLLITAHILIDCSTLKGNVSHAIFQITIREGPLSKNRKRKR